MTVKTPPISLKPSSKKSFLEHLSPTMWWRLIRQFFSVPSNKPSWVVYVSFALGISITAGVSIYFNMYKKTIQLQAFHQSVLKLKLGLDERNLRYQNLLKSLSALFNTRANLTYEEWQTFVDRVMTAELFPGILGVGYIENVSPSSLEAFKKDLEQQVRHPVKIFPDEKANPLCVMKYPAKLAIQKKINRKPGAYLGFNVCSRAVSHTAMMAARDEAKGFLTPVVRLVDDIEKKWSTLIAYYPVYKSHRAFDEKATVAQRVRELQGWVCTSIEITKYLEGFVPENIYVIIFDGKEEIYRSSPVINPSSHEQTLVVSSGGRDWTIHVGLASVQKDNFYKIISLLIPFIGFLLSSLTAIFIWSLLSTKRRALDMADYISEDLRASEFKNRTMVNNIPGAIFRCIPGINWKIEFISEGIEEVTGYSSENFTSQKVSLSQLIHQEDLDLIESNIGLVPHLDHSYSIEYRLMHRNGTLRWIYERGQVIKNHDTGSLFLTGALFDITERKEKESNLRKLTTAIQNAGEGIVFLCPDLRLLTLNQALVSILGASSLHEVVGKPITEFIHPESKKEFLLVFKDMQGLSKKTLTFKAIRVDKSEFYARISLITAYDDRGNFEGYFSFMRDVTERIREEARLAQAVEEAQAANKTKSEFLATMSHELRTPLNAIIGYSEMLMEEAEERDPDTALDLKKINNAGRHLLDLINDILDMSKLEAGKVTLHLEKFDIATMVKYLSDIITPNLEKNNNTLHIECPSNIGDMNSDFMKIKQSLLNLLSNAAKFTHDGTISLLVEKTKVNQKSFIKFSVHDTGCGITQEQIKKLFQPFIQADSSTTRKYGGTGLGLTITKQFIEMLGGTVHVDSKPSEGSTFIIMVPRITKPSKTSL